MLSFQFAWNTDSTEGNSGDSLFTRVMNSKVIAMYSRIKMDNYSVVNLRLLPMINTGKINQRSKSLHPEVSRNSTTHSVHNQA